MFAYDDEILGLQMLRFNYIDLVPKLHYTGSTFNLRPLPVYSWYKDAEAPRNMYKDFSWIFLFFFFFISFLLTLINKHYRTHFSSFPLPLLFYGQIVYIKIYSFMHGIGLLVKVNGPINIYIFQFLNVF